MADKPWSSGRILTPSQRDRKRKRDKALKKEKRILFQQRTADMEARLYRLELFTSSHLENFCDQIPQPGSTNYQALPSPIEEYRVPYLEDIESNGQLKDDYVCTNEQDSQERAVPQNSRISQLQNSTLCLIHTLDVSQVCTDETVNHDALVRGVIDGWHTLQYFYKPCPLWDILRQMDECIFFQAPVLSRLSVLKGAHILLLSLVIPETVVNVPHWYRPRPSQLCFVHETALDFFPWPGFRERLILTQYPKLTDSFWIEYTRNYQLLWSPDSIIYIWDDTLKKYRLSKTFLNAFMDINNHSMKDEFFVSFPETLIDIRP